MGFSEQQSDSIDALGKYWKKREIQSEFDMLFEEAQRRDGDFG